MRAKTSWNYLDFSVGVYHCGRKQCKNVIKRRSTITRKLTHDDGRRQFVSRGRANLIHHAEGIAVVRNHFFGNNFTGKCQLTWHALLQTFGDLCQTGIKWRLKDRILHTCLSPKQRIVSPTSRRSISVKFEHKTWIDVVIILSEHSCETLPIRDHLPQISF